MSAVFCFGKHCTRSVIPLFNVTDWPCTARLSSLDCLCFLGNTLLWFLNEPGRPEHPTGSIIAVSHEPNGLCCLCSSQISHDCRFCRDVQQPQLRNTSARRKRRLTSRTARWLSLLLAPQSSPWLLPASLSCCRLRRYGSGMRNACMSLCKHLSHVQGQEYAHCAEH